VRVGWLGWVVVGTLGLPSCGGCSAPEPPPLTADTADATQSTVATTTSVARSTSVATLALTVDEEFLSEQVSRIDVPEDGGALMVAVLYADDTAVHASAGTDPAGNSPTSDSLFRVGSITKVFTAVLTLMLVDDGLVDLDAPVADYVTRVAVPEAVVVRDLLQHTSGIPNYTGTPGFLDRAQTDPKRVWSPEETFELVAELEPLFDPGTEFRYSNSNYLILGVLIEEVTGRDFHDVLSGRIIEPLGLSNTYLAGRQAGAEPFGAYTSLFGTTAPIDFDYTAIATDAWAAGAIVSSATDLHVFLSALFDGRLISAESLTEMTEHEGYGLGIGVWDSPEGLYGHDGSIPGYLTLVVHAPITGTTAFWVATADTIDFGQTVAPIADRVGQG
jgi:D-alanyl-D-alanine carboxypeptidase